MKINYGIYIGTTSASIARMEAGVPVIIRSNTLKDSIPMAIFVNRRGAIIVGDAAMNALKSERLNALRNWNSGDDNSFAEFTRTLGSDSKYESSNAKRSFSSEELLAEVLKQLISYERDFDINAAVLTVPAAFKINQINAVRKAGYLAGLKQVEIITEDQAAALTYGLDAKRNNGFSLVFKFISNNFDTALVKSDNGILSVIDTEGDNYLGGNNLDEAIVDKIIIPFFQENFKIQELLADDYKNKVLRNSMKFYAEEIKKQLSFSDETSILTNLGDIPGEDDEGNELELDMTVTASELEKAIAPVFQKAIDMSLEMLKRNNLDGSKLNSLILVGKPTYSPILRSMLAEQICEPDTSIDPETIIVKGAAIYASTIELWNELKEPVGDSAMIQLEINYEGVSGFDEEFGIIKIIKDKSLGIIPEKVFASFDRKDGAWSSGNFKISTIGEVAEVQLSNSHSVNEFTVRLTDEFGNRLECNPSTFSIIRGIVDPAVLPYNIGIEIKNPKNGKLEFRTIRGLEKNKVLPAIGLISNFKIPKAIRPGVESDVFELGIYQGEHGADGTRAIYNHHVNTIVITGADIPALVPANSEIDIQIKVDVNQKITVLITFPHLDFTFEYDCDTVIEKSGEEQANYILNEIKKGLVSVNQLKLKGIGGVEIDKAEKGLEEIKAQFEKDKLVADKQQQILEKLRRILILIDNIEAENQWPEMEKELKEAFNNLEEINKKKGNEKTTKMVNDIKPNVGQAIREKDKKHIPALIEMIKTLGFELTNNVSKSKDEVEDLLFQLTEDGLIPAKAFQEFYEQLSNMNGDSVLLEKLNKDIKAYESK